MANISIRKRKNGKVAYQIRVDIGTSKNGRRVQRFITYHPKETAPTKVKKEVEAFAIDFERQCKEGKGILAKNLKFEDLVEKWNTSGTKRLTESVIEQYNDILNRIWMPRLECMRLSTISVIELQDIVDELDKNGLKPATIKKYVTALSSIFSFAFRQQIIDENPTKRLLLPPIEKLAEDDNSISIEEGRRFLEALDKPLPIVHKAHMSTQKDTKEPYFVPEFVEMQKLPLQMKLFFLLSYMTSCRRGELIALTFKDFNWEKKTVSITKAAASTKKDGQIVKETKTAAGKRTFSIPQICFDTLALWREEQLKMCQEYGTAWQGKRGNKFDEGYVFIQWDGKMMHLSTPTHAFKDFINHYNKWAPEDEQFSDVHLHDVRHFGASLLLAAGVDPETVAKRLGHSKVAMTLDVYGYAMPEKDKAAVRVLDKFSDSIYTPQKALPESHEPLSDEDKEKVLEAFKTVMDSDPSKAQMILDYINRR